jgi:8-oxo-dGTP diphosphatase
MNKLKKQPAVGVAAIILNGNKIILGQRLKEPMLGSWQLPGGWLHSGETPEQAIKRKAGAFPGILCGEVSFVTYTNNFFENGMHTVSLYFQMQCLNPQDLALHHNKDCSDWFWADWYDLPNPLFYPLQLLIQSGYMPLNGEK